MRTWINAFCACLLLLSGLCQATETYVTYYHNDHLGSPAAATDEQGKLLWRAHYRPYGEREPHRDSAAFGTLGYTGHAQNERNGLVYAGARYYDPLVGRFLSVDPVGPKQAVPGSFNRYAYALNNPYRYVDPDGQWAEDMVIGVASVSIGAYSLGRNVSDGNWSAAAVDLGGLVLDGIAMAVPVVPAAAGLAIQATRAGKSANATTAEQILQAERIGSGLKDDAAHRAASFLSKEQLQAGKTFPLRGGDGVEHTLLQTQGGLNGKDGIYEYILDPSGKVTHQRFIESGVINGTPNQRANKARK
ncbi:tRNA3(Ser)-specific nuclease WapA precursor [compost metagenome]